MTRRKDWQGLNTCQRWKKWRKPFTNDATAIARLVWTLNKMAKLQRRFGNSQFYLLKDEFITRHQDHLVVGRIARVEQIRCLSCGGCSDAGYGSGKCLSCNGTGYEEKTRTLYQHDFVIEGQHYSFHSYKQPRIMAEEPGQDLPEYGTPLTAAELRRIPLPFDELLGVLEHAVSEIWGVLPYPTEKEPYEHVKKELISVTGMKLEFGLTDALVKKIGEPDRFGVNPHYSSAPKTRLYKRERVEQWVRENPLLIENAAARKASAKAAAQRKGPSPKRAPPQTNVTGLEGAASGNVPTIKGDRVMSKNIFMKAGDQHPIYRDSWLISTSSCQYSERNKPNVEDSGDKSTGNETAGLSNNHNSSGVEAKLPSVD